MIKLKILDTYYRIINGYTINESSREVKFSNLKIEFTDKTINDLPKKYQEIQLVDVDDNNNIKDIIYTGYVNNFILPNMKNSHEYRELEIDLLSPLAMATLRTVDAVGTYYLKSLISELVMPLISDGFTLKEMNIGNNQITVNFLNETIESSLNKLSNKFNFWWYIDKNKNIYINSIEYLINKTPKIIYNDNNKVDGLIDIIPSIDATDYCNVVNFTNLRLFTESYFTRDEQDGEIIYEYKYPLKKLDYINSGDEIEFDIPFDATPTNFVKSEEYRSSNTNSIFSIFTNPSTEVVRVTVDSNNNLVLPNNVSIQDGYNEENEWVLVRDPFFKNLIVGLKYNGETNIQIYSISSSTALMWTKLKVIDNEEVYKNKGIISQSGIVEKQIDMNEQWKTFNEVLSIANSYIKKNISAVEQVKFNLDKNINVEVGDTINIDKETFLIKDTYIVTDKNVTFQDNYTKWNYTLKNTNILENYVDLFRAKEEEAQDKEYNLITANYEEEGFAEKYEVVIL